MIPNLHELLHPKGFFAALWPYRFMAMVFGHCNTPSKKFRAIYTIVAITVSLVSSYFVVNRIHHRQGEIRLSVLEAAIDNLTSYFQISIVPIHIVTWFFVGHSCYTKVVASLTHVDRELEKICCRQVNMKMTVIRQLICVFLELLIAIIISAGRIALRINSKVVYFSFDIVAIHSRMISIVIATFFGNLVWFVGERYALINSALKGIGHSVKIESAAGNRSRMVFDEIKLTKQLRVVHRELFFVSRKVMDAFAIQMFTCVLFSSTSTVYTAYIEYKIGSLSPNGWTMDQVFFTVSEISYNFGVIIYVGHCCHKTVREANGTTKILNSLRTDSEDLRLEVSSFSYQLMHYQLDFSPLGLYQLDLALVQSMVGSMATYLIVLIQMKPSVLSDAESPNNTTASQIM